MKIGIDISQLAYSNTGVANYLSSLVDELVKNEEIEFVLFFSSLRGKFQISNSQKSSAYFKFLINKKNVKIKKIKLPPAFLDLLWNKLHIAPIEWFIGDVDIFITSDWTEPPVKHAKKATILYDLITYKFPEETASNIIAAQKKKLEWVKKESDMVFCISESTKKDAEKILGIEEHKLKVIYPGV
jgi:glycosyltransferase involved in cell wall biosynthesis